VKGINGEAIAERFGDNLPSDDVTPFKDKNFFALLRKIPRGDQSVVPRADDDVVVLIFVINNSFYFLHSKHNF
jgi:hypothetical protein